jgi:hypothetical protein
LQIFQGTFCDVDRKQQFRRLLLNHSNVVEDGFVIGVNVESLREQNQS